MSGWDMGNDRSGRAHERAGFKIVGRSNHDNPNVPQHVLAIWQGDGQVKKEETVFKNVPDL